VRLLEQKRVRHVFAEDEAEKALGAVGLGSHLLVFRPGIFDSACRPIECYCVSNNPTARQP
jgi:hypothetical protein